jgi:hypothetical protein
MKSQTSLPVTLLSGFSGYSIFRISIKVNFPLSWREGMKGRGVETFENSSTSHPHPNPLLSRERDFFDFFTKSSILGIDGFSFILPGPAVFSGTGE